ncbi:hypothetical protein [Desulfonatronovibrio hydrogenovorans]|uniref:hypothetical protein n=1 Tax=Desulfonatronovibrio hydrogenovorans TaxID=53245 RepID=UPI00048EDCA5|nr:hypothetical protein [Desulfonatronovibrio hydrogenovorans]
MMGLFAIFKSKKIIIPLIMVFLLAGVAGFVWWRFEDALRETGRQAQIIIQQIQDLKDMEQRISEIEAERERIERLFALRELQVQELKHEYQTLRQDMHSLELEARKWALDPLPAPIVERLRQATDPDSYQD